MINENEVCIINKMHIYRMACVFVFNYVSLFVVNCLHLILFCLYILGHHGRPAVSCLARLNMGNPVALFVFFLYSYYYVLFILMDW